MPTRPRRLERRRRERANAHIPLSTASLYHALGTAGSFNALGTAGLSHTPSTAGTSQHTPQLTPQSTSSPSRLRAPLVMYSEAPLFVRAIMRTVLLGIDFTHSQMIFFKLYIDHLEEHKPSASHASFSDYEQGLKRWCDLIKLHAVQLRILIALTSAFAKQLVMWGFECSKPGNEWDHSSIFRRKLEVAQLKHETVKAVKEFEEQLVSDLCDARLLFSAEIPKVCFVQRLEWFRGMLRESMTVASAKTFVELLRETGRSGEVQDWMFL